MTADPWTVVDEEAPFPVHRPVDLCVHKFPPLGNLTCLSKPRRLVQPAAEGPCVMMHVGEATAETPIMKSDPCVDPGKWIKEWSTRAERWLHAAMGGTGAPTEAMTGRAEEPVTFSKPRVRIDKDTGYAVQPGATAAVGVLRRLVK